MRTDPVIQNDPATTAAGFADFLHRESKTVPTGAAFSPAIVPTSIYALPGRAEGSYQYARWSNPGWSALEEALGALENAQSAPLSRKPPTQCGPASSPSAAASDLLRILFLRSLQSGSNEPSVPQTRLG